MDKFAEELREEIDRSVMIQILEGYGWTKIDLSHRNHSPKAVLEMDTWCKAHAKDGYYSHSYRTWVFKSEKDAVLFALRWA